MAKKILLIENDAAFATRVSDALEAAGFEVRATGDGKEGLDLARDASPDAIVLCVELPGMSGYLVCQKLKKDDRLKALPLVLTSAEATEETFEKHRTLKARADEYLLKPYAPAALIEKLGALVGLPEGLAVEVAPEEELVALEEEVGAAGSADESPDREIPGLDLDSLPDEPAAPSDGGPLDDDLKLLDDAFDGIAVPPSRSAESDLDELAGGKADGEGEESAPLPDEDAGRGADLGSLDSETESALDALGADDETLSPGAGVEPEPPTRPVRGASADILRAAGVKLLDDAPAARGRAPAIAPPAPEPRGGRGFESGAGRGPESRELEGKVRDLERRLREAEEEAAEARTKASAAASQLRKAESDARRAAEEARDARAEIEDLERKVADAERRADAAESEARRKADENASASEALARSEALEREADDLRTELLVARGEADGARNEIEKRTADLRSRAADAEASAQKNEERVIKAYQKIKADEKVRDKVRKALSIAMQLLEDGLPSESASEKERRAASGGARE